MKNRRRSARAREHASTAPRRQWSLDSPRVLLPGPPGRKRPWPGPGRTRPGPGRGHECGRQCAERAPLRRPPQSARRRWKQESTARSGALRCQASSAKLPWQSRRGGRRQARQLRPTREQRRRPRRKTNAVGPSLSGAGGANELQDRAARPRKAAQRTCMTAQGPLREAGAAWARRRQGRHRYESVVASLCRRIPPLPRSGGSATAWGLRHCSRGKATLPIWTPSIGRLPSCWTAGRCPALLRRGLWVPRMRRWPTGSNSTGSWTRRTLTRRWPLPSCYWCRTQQTPRTWHAKGEPWATATRSVRARVRVNPPALVPSGGAVAAF